MTCLERKEGALERIRGNAVYPFWRQRTCRFKRQQLCCEDHQKTPLRLDIDLKPALSKEQLDARILRDFDEAKNKQFKNSLNHLFPAKLIPVMIDRSGIDPEKQVNEVTAEERKRLVDLTKRFRDPHRTPRVQ